MLRRTLPAAALFAAVLSAVPAVAQEDGPRRIPPPQLALQRLDSLAGGLGMSEPQARAFATMRAAAAKVAADPPPGPSDPFVGASGPLAEEPGGADRAAFRAAGSRFFDTLDEGERSVVSREWRPVVAAFMHPPGGRRRDDRMHGRDRGFDGRDLRGGPSDAEPRP